MFTRLKQMVREKTGRAQATQFFPELQRNIEYVERWETRDRAILKGFNELGGLWKQNSQRLQMIQALGNIAEDCVGEVQDGASALANYQIERVKMERQAYENGVGYLEQQLKKFFAGELTVMRDSVKLLKKKRLMRDATESDYTSKPCPERQVKFEAAEVDFKAQVEATERLLEKIPDLDKLHGEYIANALGYIAATFGSPSVPFPGSS